jgi:predicted DNA-binding antitoxin AbrB/MazE fold protein
MFVWYNCFFNCAKSQEVRAMAFTVEAVYEDGVLKPAQPLPFREHEKVHLTVQPVLSRARQTAGLLRWKGDPALLERLIMDPELDPSEGS